MIKAGSWGNAETKGRHCLKYSPQKSWKSTFRTVLAQIILVLLTFAKLNRTSFQYQGPKQIAYLCVLVRNGNLVYKEWFNLDLVKKMKPVLKHQAKLLFSFEESSNEKGQIHEGGLQTDAKGDPSAWRGTWHLTPIPDMIIWTPHLVCYCKALLLSPFIPLKLLPPTEKNLACLIPIGTVYGGERCCLATFPSSSSLVSSAGVPSLLSPVPPLVWYPWSSRGAGKEMQVQTLLAARSKYGRAGATAVSACKKGSPYLKGAAAVNAPEQTHPLLEIFSVSLQHPQPERKDVQMPCCASRPPHSSLGEKGLWDL